MNIIIKTSDYTKRDIEIIFEDEPVIFMEDVTLDILCKDLGIYKSTSEARRAGRIGNIPKGYSEIKASKKVILYVWNPED